MTSLKNVQTGPTLAYTVLAILWIYTFYVSVLTPPSVSYTHLDVYKRQE